jgi:hypothetical protein
LVSVPETPFRVQVTLAYEVPGPVLGPTFHVHDTSPEPLEGFATSVVEFEAVPEA